MAFFSNNSGDYSSAIQSLVKPTYESKYENTISNLMDKIANKEDFSYDFNADPLYQNYKDQYTKLGNEASMNAVANTSAMTGGFANSYSATAASQANQQYLTQLNNVIPDLYDAAMQKYQNEVDDLYNQFNMYETEENRQYGQYRDNVSDYYSDLSDLRSGYDTAVSNEQWQQEFAENQRQYNQNYDYQKSRDAVSDDQWQKEYDLSYYSAHKSSGSGSGTTYKTSDVYNNSTKHDMRIKMLNTLNSSSDKLTKLYDWYEGGSISEGDYYAFRDELGL